MNLSADQYYYVYFCMFEEPAMSKPLSYSSECVSIHSRLCFQLITQASRQKTYEQAVQIYLCQWRVYKKILFVHFIIDFSGRKFQLSFLQRFGNNENFKTRNTLENTFFQNSKLSAKRDRIFTASTQLNYKKLLALEKSS